MSDSGGGVAGTFRRLFGRSSGKSSRGQSGHHARLERRHSSVDRFGRSPRHGRGGAGTRGDPFVRHSFAEGAGDELRAQLDVSSVGPVSASSKLQQAMRYVDLPRHLMLEFMQQEQKKLEAQEAAAAAARASSTQGGASVGSVPGQGAAGAAGAGGGSESAGGNDAGGDADSFLRPTMDGVVAVGGSPMLPARERASSFQDRRARLLSQARARVIAWVDEGLQSAPGTVAKLQVMSLLPAMRDVVRDSEASQDGSDGRLASVPVTPGAARSRAASVGARLMAAHKSIYLSQQPIPSVAKLLEFLDTLAGQAPVNELDAALAAAHATHAAVPVVAALNASPPNRTRTHSIAAREGGDGDSTPARRDGVQGGASDADPGSGAPAASPCGRSGNGGDMGAQLGSDGDDVGGVDQASLGSPNGPGCGEAGNGSTALASGSGPGAAAAAVSSPGSGHSAAADGSGDGSEGPGSTVAAAAASDEGAAQSPPPSPPSDLEVFTTKLKDAGAAAIVELLRAFITSFRSLDFERLYDANVSPDSDDEWSFDPPSNTPMSPDTSGEDKTPPARRVRNFLARMEKELRHHPMWRAETHDPDRWQTTVDAMETFVTSKIYDRVFSVPSFRKKDRELKLAIEALTWITFEHVDMPATASNFMPAWELAQEALCEINAYRATEYKAACIMNCCRVISTILTIMSKDGQGVGADEFLPALIYTVIHANPDRLFSNLKYVVSYLQPAKLMSEQGYFITNVLSAVAFVRNIKPSYLSNLEPGEFQERMVQSRGRVLELRARLEMDGDELQSLSGADADPTRGIGVGAFARVAARHGMASTPRGTHAVPTKTAPQAVTTPAPSAPARGGETASSVGSMSFQGRTVSGATSDDGNSSVASSRLSTNPTAMGAAAAIARAAGHPPRSPADALDGTQGDMGRDGGPHSVGTARLDDPTDTVEGTPDSGTWLGAAPGHASGQPRRQRARSRRRSSITGVIDSILNDSDNGADDSSDDDGEDSFGDLEALAEAGVAEASPAVPPPPAPVQPPPPPSHPGVVHPPLPRDTPTVVTPASGAPSAPPASRTSVVADPLGIARFARHHRGSSPVTVTIASLSPASSPHTRAAGATNKAGLGQRVGTASTGSLTPVHSAPGSPLNGSAAGVGVGTGPAGAVADSGTRGGDGWPHRRNPRVVRDLACERDGADAAAGLGEVMALADDVADLAAACAGGEPSSEAATALLQDGEYSPVALYNYLGALLGVPPVHRIPAAAYCGLLNERVLSALETADTVAPSAMQSPHAVAGGPDDSERSSRFDDPAANSGCEDIDWETSSDEEEEALVASGEHRTSLLGSYSPRRAHPAARTAEVIARAVTTRGRGAAGLPFEDPDVCAEELALPQVAMLLEEYQRLAAACDHALLQALDG